MLNSFKKLEGKFQKLILIELDLNVYLITLPLVLRPKAKILIKNK